MGSGSTVLLSLARGYTLALVLFGLLIKLFSMMGWSDPTYTIRIILVMLVMYFVPSKLSNYFESPMNPWVEILLPFGLIYLLYTFIESEYRWGVMLMAGYWLAFIVWVLWDRVEGGIDNNARRNTFGF